MTIQGLINKIFKANQTQNNTVSWSGSNGLKSIQEDIVDTIRQRTFFTVPTTTDLLNQGFNNAVLCYVQDNAFYRWEPSGIPNGTTIFPANDGGVWVQETIGDTDGTVTSIGLSMPAAFTVANSPVTTSGVIGVTANGTSAQYIKGDGTLGTLPTPTGGTVTNVSALTLNTSGTDLSSTVANPTTTPVITLSVPTASAVNRGVLSPTDWSTFNGKQNAITLTTTGTSGAATLVGSTLNIPQYQSVITNPVTGTGTSGQVTYWNGTNSVTGSNTFAYTPTSQLLINNSVTASSAIARGTNITPTLIASANNDVLVGLDVNPTFTNGVFTGLNNLALRTLGNVLINSTTSLVNSSTSGYPLQVIGGNGGSALFSNAGKTQALNINLTTTGETRIYGDYFGAGVDQKLILGTFANRATQLVLQTTGNVSIGSTTDAGYKLDVNGTARVITSLQVGNFTPGVAGAASTILTQGRISASGGITFYNPAAGDNQDLGFKAGGNGVGIYINNGIIGSFGGYGGSLNPLFNLSSNYNPSSGTGNKNLFSLTSTYQTSGTFSGGITGILYSPALASLTGVTYHRAIQTVTGDVLFGTTSGSVGIGANTSINASTILDITSTTQGFLKPRMTTTQRNAIATPATGLEVYNTTTNTEDYYNGTTWVSLQTTAAATKSFGAWQHNVTQTAAANNTGYGVKFATGDITGQGVDIINDLSANPTLIKMNNTGYYNIQFSFQFQNTDTGDQDVTIWLRKNGETTPFDVSSSAGFVSVPSSHGGTPGHCIAAWNYFVQANSGDYFQLVWSTTLASRVEMEYYAAGSPPPAAASAILTVNQVN
jgi:hypothetical protein